MLAIAADFGYSEKVVAVRKDDEEGSVSDIAIEQEVNQPEGIRRCKRRIRSNTLIETWQF